MPSSLGHSLQKPREEVADGSAVLFHRVAVTDVDGVLVGGVVVILAALADGVEVEVEARWRWEASRAWNQRRS